MIKKIALVVMMFLFFVIIFAGLTYKGYNITDEKPTSAQGTLKVNMNGKPLKTAPVFKDEQIYLPLRAVSEELGYKTVWEAPDITLTKGKTVVKMTIGNCVITVDKREYKLTDSITAKNPPILENDTAYLTMQAMEDVFDTQINYNEESMTINISYNDEKINYITFSDGLGKTTIPFSYSDSYFDKSSHDYSPEIAELSVALSSGSHTISSLNKAYKKMGFKAEFFNYDATDRTASAFSIASKELDKAKVYIVTVRGTIGDEWYTNFEIYKDRNTPSTVHYGFSQAEKGVKEVLEKVLDEDDYKGRRILLITGHSRGGAVANLLAAQLTKGGKYAAAEDIYAYTFATPNVSSEADEKMKNIYNFCSANDFITQIPINGTEYDVAEKEWLYKKNGSTIVFDSSDIKQVKITSNMEREFKSLTGRTFVEIRRDAVQTAIASLKLLLPTVDDYYNKPLGIGNLQMSAYEFFISGLAASQTLGEAAEKGMMILADGLFKGDLSPISQFIVFNSSGKTKKNDDGSITQKGQGIKYNHCCEAYYTWVRAYNRCFFGK